jgi:hypothetical protein
MGLGWAWPATAPIYINWAAINAPPDPAPQVDATVFINAGSISINDFFTSGASLPGMVPFETSSTRFFTNMLSGWMDCTPGVRFDYKTPSTRRMMDWWVSHGAITGATWLLISSSNVLNRGSLQAGPSGLLRIESKNADLERSSLRASFLPGLGVSDGFFVTTSSNYVNASGVSDYSWAVGTNNVMRGTGDPMPLDDGKFNLPFPQAEPHEVATRFFSTPFETSLFVADAAAFAYTRTINATSRVVQVVFVRTNYFNPNLSVNVRFAADRDPGRTAMVEFTARLYDLAARSYQTSRVYFVDGTAFSTNLTLLNMYQGSTRRPNSMAIGRSTPFAYVVGETNNTPYTPALLYNPAFASNAVTVAYAAYGATINEGTTDPFDPLVTSTTEPTNLPGRVEITADTVNMNQTRIRAESTVIIRAKSVVSNILAQVDAPYCLYDLASTQNPFVISNLAPATVERLSGYVQAWSATWDNLEQLPTATNTVRFHVLMLDASFQTQQPVVVNEFRARATNLVVSDFLSFGKSMVLEARDLTVEGGLSLPEGSSWNSANVLQLINFTNTGWIYIPGIASYGTDRSLPNGQPWPYHNFVNYGTNEAMSQQVLSTNFLNTGCLQARSGVLSVQSERMALLGAPIVPPTWVTNVFIFGTNVFTNAVPVGGSPGAKLTAGGELRLSGQSLLASNSWLQSGSNGQGTLVFSVTNRLVDGGPGSTNYWQSSGGVQMLHRPAQSDLKATYLTLTAPDSSWVVNTWAAEDRGKGAVGYSNNLALGKLTLDGADFTTMQFGLPAGMSAPRALYVDYLELQNNLTNYNGALVFEPGFTLYFANANIPPEKLDGAANGGLRWVSSYAGPLSFTNIVYPSGSVLTTNIALAQSKELDSDFDGRVNFEDATPFFLPESVDLRLKRTKGCGALGAEISWNALGGATNILEATANATAWQTVTNFVPPGLTAPARLCVPLTNSLRLYRIRIVSP